MYTSFVIRGIQEIYRQFREGLYSCHAYNPTNKWKYGAINQAKYADQAVDVIVKA